jgi:hypothetical protein
MKCPRALKRGAWLCHTLQLAHAGQVIGRLVVIASRRIARAQAWSARHRVTVIAVRNVERQVDPFAAFAQDLGLSREGFGEARLKFIAFGHTAAEHTVSLDHWS